MRWTQSVGLTLVNRDLNSLQLKTPSGQILSFYILQTFPFTSESKRMGIIVRVCIYLWMLLFSSPSPVFLNKGHTENYFSEIIKKNPNKNIIYILSWLLRSNILFTVVLLTENTLILFVIWFRKSLLETLHSTWRVRMLPWEALSSIMIGWRKR